jgi:hypothetical protein
VVGAKQWTKSLPDAADIRKYCSADFVVNGFVDHGKSTRQAAAMNRWGR